jgi:N-acetylmuramoyl-L-alanine amidase
MPWFIEERSGLLKTEVMRFQSLVGRVTRVISLFAMFASVDLAISTYAQASDKQEITCLALTIYHEARGESDRGKLAVGYVVLNRTHSTLFPGGVCDVVRQGGQRRHRCQFSWWCDGRSDQAKEQDALRESLKLAEEIYYGCRTDPTNGSLWYHSTAVKPSWSKSFGPGKRIDRHVFYRGDLNRPAKISAFGPTSDGCADRRSPRQPLMTASRSDS